MTAKELRDWSFNATQALGNLTKPETGIQVNVLIFAALCEIAAQLEETRKQQLELVPNFTDISKLSNSEVRGFLTATDAKMEEASGKNELTPKEARKKKSA